MRAFVTIYHHNDTIKQQYLQKVTFGSWKKFYKYTLMNGQKVLYGESIEFDILLEKE